MDDVNTAEVNHF